MRRLGSTLPIAVLTASLTLSSCGAGADREQQDTLRIAGPFEVHSLDPAIDGEVFTRLQVSETLVTSDLDGELAPALASSWTASRRNTVWRFDLVSGATFHDGTEVTPDDVATSLERAAAESASPLAAVPVRRVEAHESSVSVELSKPYLTLPAVLTHYSTQILAPSSYDERGRVVDVVGTGPYEVRDVELPAAIETERFEDYRGEAPSIDEVSYSAVGRPESRALLAASGQADVVFGLEPAGRARVERTDAVEMHSSLQPRTIMLKLNADHSALGDLSVRRALSLALDREAMAGAVLREEELAATRLLPPSLTAWEADLEPLTHDQDQARTLLAEAGWRPGPDGTLEKGGEPLELNLLTYPDRAELPALATAIQAAWKEIGVAVEVDVTNSSEIPARQADGTLELALIAKSFALVSDPLIDIAEVFAPEGSDWGVMNWSDPEMDRAVGSLLSDLDGAEEHRATVARVAHEQLPLIPVAWYRMNAAVSDRVSGFALDPMETTWRLTDLRWEA